MVGCFSSGSAGTGPQMGTWLLVHALLGLKLSCQLQGVGWQQQVLDCTIKANYAFCTQAHCWLTAGCCW